MQTVGLNIVGNAPRLQGFSDATNTIVNQISNLASPNHHATFSQQLAKATLTSLPKPGPFQEHTNLLSGRKQTQELSHSKENPLKRKSSDKKFKSPNNARNSATLLKEQSYAGLLENKRLGTQKTMLGSIGNAMQNLSPTNAFNQAQQLLSRKTQNLVVIHVCDESKKKSQDFKCDRTLLLTHMKYFEKYIVDQKSLDDIDISVHCDIVIFEWLMNYVNGLKPDLDIKSVVSILISSDFLQMQPLVERTIEYIANNLQEVILLPIDMSCMNPALVKQLGRKVTMQVLESLTDKKDKLKSKLFMKKLETLFETKDNYLHRCINCSGLFTKKQRSWQVCPNQKAFIDAQGKVKREHVIDQDWDLSKFVVWLKAKKIEWKDLYWKMFALTVDFKCQDCGEQYTGNRLSNCSYHPSNGLNGLNFSELFYPCCQQSQQRFGAWEKAKGCENKQHFPTSVTDEYEWLQNNLEQVSDPQAHKTTENSICHLIPEYIKSIAPPPHQEASDSDDELCPSGLIKQSDKLFEIQNEQAISMYKKRAVVVKKCEFRKWKEQCRDFLSENDNFQLQMISKQLVKLRNEDKKQAQKREKTSVFSLDIKPKAKPRSTSKPVK